MIYEKLIEIKSQNEQIINFAKKLLEINKPIYIIGHLNTDYDSIGSSFSLCEILCKLNKKAKVFLDGDGLFLAKKIKGNSLSKFLAKDIDKIEKDYCAILVDMNKTSRAGNFEDIFLNANIKVNIDHHDNNDMIADFKYVDEKSGSNCENIFLIAKCLENLTKTTLIDKKLSYLLTIGIITDTCNIEKSSFIEQTKEIITELQSFKVNTEKLAKKYYHGLTKEQKNLLKNAIQNLETINKLNYSYIDTTKLKREFMHYDYVKVLAEIIKLYPNVITLFEQKFENYSIWEFRSNNPETYPVNEIALSLGGGGHKNASGATTTNLSSQEVIDKFKILFD